MPCRDASPQEAVAIVPAPPVIEARGRSRRRHCLRRATVPPRALPESPVAQGALASDHGARPNLLRAQQQAIPRSAARRDRDHARTVDRCQRVRPCKERAVSDAAQAVWARDDATTRASPAEAAEARRLNDEAIRAYWYRRNVAEAFELQMKAFGANPYDPEVAGNLAFLHLRVNPAQPEMARQLALHAIAVRGAQYPAGRLEDWNTYAVASALTGRR